MSEVFHEKRTFLTISRQCIDAEKSIQSFPKIEERTALSQPSAAVTPTAVIIHIKRGEGEKSAMCNVSHF